MMFIENIFVGLEIVSMCEWCVMFNVQIEFLLKKNMLVYLNNSCSLFSFNF